MSPVNSPTKDRGFEKLKNDILGPQVPIRQKFFALVFFAMTGGCFLGALINIFLETPYESVISLFAMAFISPLLALWGAYIKERQEIFLQGSIAVLNLFVFPFLYFTSGGIDSGVPPYFVLGLALTLFLTRTNFGYVMAAVEALVYILIIYFSHKYPDWILSWPAIEVPGSAAARQFTFTTILMNTFAAASLLGFLTKTLFNMYKAENKLVVDSIAEIKRLSTIDPLTNVYNRRYMYTYLTEQLESTKKTGAPLSVVLFDIDKFKLLNDNYGHLVGDEVLKAFSHILKNACRPGEIVARYGGEEFLMVLPGLDNDAAYKRANEIRECLEQSYLSPELPKDKPVTISGGVSTYSDGLNEEKMVSIADENLYAAKEGGRNRIKK